MSPSERSAVARARERFAAGDDEPGSVRPEIGQSWLRCRDGYGVDPELRSAPVASAEPGGPGLEQEVVLAELSAIAHARRDELAPGVVTVVDRNGRLVGEWGHTPTRRRIAEANLAPWSAWSEAASGTNGMGTALASHGVTTVHGPEHWCQGFQALDCAGIAVHDPVTDAPLAALNVSTLENPLPNATLTVLTTATEAVERSLAARARQWAADLVRTLEGERPRRSAPMAAIDVGAQLVAADATAARLLGTKASTPALDPSARTKLDVPDLEQLVERAVEHARAMPGWRGSVRLALPGSLEPTEATIVPVFSSGHATGALLLLGVADGEPLSPEATPGAPLRRIVAQRGERSVLLKPDEIRFAEVDRNTVWLHTDRGRLRAATRGLHHVESLLGRGFLRVHRRFVVNLVRISEFERGFNGELLLATDSRAERLIPVSRARTRTVLSHFGL